MGLSVFVSYSTRDLGHARRVVESLRHVCSDVYFAEDSLRAGSKLSPSIESAIRSCDLFILLWSASARNSIWMQQEIGIAKGTRKSILPVALDRDTQLPAFIHDLKYVPWYVDPDAALRGLVLSVFERDQQRLIEQVRLLLALLFIVGLLLAQPMVCECAA